MSTIQLEKITPARAQKYLNKNKLNRKLREGMVEKYAYDMKNGMWTQCVAPIVFYDTGDIADGQHRLWAIIESDTAQSFYVMRNLKREDGFNIDTGAVRSVVDNAHIAGRSENLTNALVSLARAIEEGDRASRNLSYSQRYVMMEKHSEAAHWALTHGAKGRYLQNSVVNAAIARAWYVEKDRDRLVEFGRVISTGFANGMEDSAAVAIRNYMLTQKSIAHSSAVWKDAFIRIQNAVWYFMRRKPLTIIKTRDEERYPLAKENRALTARVLSPTQFKVRLQKKVQAKENAKKK